MTLYEAISIFFSSIALLISGYTLYISRKKGRLIARFDIRMYQIAIDIVNVGENPLVVTNINVNVDINGSSYFGILPKEHPVLPQRIGRFDVLRLEDFSESITRGLETYFPNINSLPAKISIYIETSQGDNYHRVHDQLIDLFKSVELSKQLRSK